MGGEGEDCGWKDCVEVCGMIVWGYAAGCFVLYLILFVFFFCFFGKVHWFVGIEELEVGIGLWKVHWRSNVLLNYLS